ncbi:MAG: VWA domain-containing protein [Myxococcota bacterium]
MTTLQPPRSRELEALTVKATRAFVDSGLHGIEAEVVVVLDVSPRMAPLYLDGSMQELVNALLALAMKFDDDGVVPIWTFADEARPVGKLRRDDYLAWVERHLQAPPLMRPGMRVPPSRYSPFIDAIAQKYFPREWATPPRTYQVGTKLKRTIHEYAKLAERRECPIFVIIVTSGDCDDPLETSRQLRRASHLPIFWQFAAVSPTEGQSPDFRFLRGIDRLTETHVDCCGFFEAGRLNDAEHLYGGLLGEFQRYVELPPVRAMLVDRSDAEAETPSESNDRISAHVLSLPESEAMRREQARLERERRRAERESHNEAELARAAAYPRVSPDAEAPDEEVADPAEAPPEPQPARPTTRPTPRVKRETLPYGTEANPAPAPLPTPPPRLNASTRTFARYQTPVPRAPEPAAVDAPASAAQHHDDDDLEDTVETAAERLLRIRARREARKVMNRTED